MKIKNLILGALSIIKSKKTFTFYNYYWNKINALIGDKINNITQ